ncbi:MAG TPA: hypothetical protein VE360_18660 [Pyrinomonadaceae bacterium]|nr:hypothetical protein [Pyrinomonadaceae bacterium]
MPRLLVYAVLSAAVLLQGAAARAQAQRADEQVLTNASVIKLVRGGFSERAVIAIINSRPARFDLTTERLIELKKSRVSERVILAMIGRTGGEEVSAEDDWEMETDPFFKDSTRPRPDRGASAPPGAATGPGETNIFGSSGNSRGRVKSRDGRGGVENDTETIGSASVRIMRPPAEAGGNGGAATKLERTPTLTNEAVAQLVEAGFSDGTIIRRIEQSPVEFDLSDAKLAELRKRRVGEPVIAAMKAAMSDDAAAPGAKPEE